MPNISIQDPLSNAVKYLVISGATSGIGGVLDVTNFKNIQTITANSLNIGLSGFNISPTINTAIQTINLNNGNVLTGTIADYSQFNSLKTLNLGSNKYTGISDFTNTNSSINTFLVNGNTAMANSKVPNINNLTAATNISFSACGVTGLLTSGSFSNLTAINSINFANCKLTGILPSLSSMTGFGTGNFQNNNLTGFAGTANFPLGGIAGLSLDLGSNKLTSSGIAQIIISAYEFAVRTVYFNGKITINGGTNAGISTGDMIFNNYLVPLVSTYNWTILYNAI